MITSILSGTYVSGYAIDPSTNILSITPTGYVTTAVDAAYAAVTATTACSIANDGAVVGRGDDGVDLAAGDTLTNGSPTDAAALIQGGENGVVVAPGAVATVTNYGTIAGLGGVSVSFDDTADRLVVEAGSTFIGAVQGGGGTLELAGGTGTISGLGGTGTISVAEAVTFSDFGAYVTDAGSAWTLSGYNSLAVGQSLYDPGSVTVAGYLANAGSISGGVGAAGDPSVDSGAGGNGGDGITVASGGSLANTGAISGGQGGVGISSLGGMSGTGGAGAYVQAGGSLTNTGGTITGGQGGDHDQAYSYNAGTGGAGVELASGATLSNTGAIYGGAGGIGYPQPGSGGDGVVFLSGGTAINGSPTDTTALIQGVFGAYAAPGSTATLINYGTISGSNGVSVSFDDTADRLVVEAGSTFIGAVQGGGGTLELAGGTGTISGLGGTGTISVAEAVTFSDFGAYVTDAGSAWTLSGYNSLAVGQSLYDPGSVTVAGYLANAGSISGGVGAAGDPSVDSGAGGNGGDGITVASGGSLANTGAISGGQGGVGISSLGGMSGTGGAGAYVQAGGSLTNTGGTITGGQGGDHDQAYSYNAGTGGAGVELASGATLSNTGAIYGGAGGIGYPQPGSGGDGVVFLSGGTAINGSPTDTTALIQGVFGAYAAPGSTATLINYGTISGSNGVSVQFNAAGDRLIVEAGSTFSGRADGEGGTLELAGGTGTITGLGGTGTISVAEALTFSGFGTYVLDAGGSWTLTGANTIAFGDALTDAEPLVVAAGATLTSAGAVRGAGTLSLIGDAAFDTGAHLTVADADQSGGTADFAIASLTYAGVWSQKAGTVSVASGDWLGFTGAGDSFAGTVAGAGTVAFRAGSVAFDGAALTAAHVSVSGATASLSGVIENDSALSLAGALTVESAGASLIGTGFLSMTSLATIIGATAASTLTVDQLLLGAGDLGEGQMTLAVSSTGTVDASLSSALTLDTGANTISNAGLLEAAGAGALVIASALDNTGKVWIATGDKTTLEGVLNNSGAVSGGGTLVLSTTADFNSGTSLTVTHVTQSAGVASVAEPTFGYAGVWTQTAGTFSVGVGDRANFTGTGDAFAGTLTGTGTLAFAGGSDTFDAGADLTVAKVSQSGASTVIVTDPALEYTGLWFQTAGTVSASSGDRIDFSGNGDSFAGTLAGAGTVDFIGGSDSLVGATLSATSVVINGPSVTLVGTIAVTQQLTATSANLVVAAAGATLSGGGKLVLTNLSTNTLVGANAGATLTNDDTILGSGDIGGSKMTLVNDASGVITGTTSAGLTLDTGAKTIVNAGLIQASGAGSVTVKSALVNNHSLWASGGGVLTLDAAVTGTGSAGTSGGALDFAAAFNQNVAFTGTSGVLELADSQAFTTGKVSGFSKTGGTSLDLRDISFTLGVTTASFVENAALTAGVLTVTDGTHTARINLVGNYKSSVFTPSSDGHGGTTVVDPTAASPGAATVQHRFIAAMASAVSLPGGAVAAPHAWRAQASLLAVSGAHLA